MYLPTKLIIFILTISTFARAADDRLSRVDAALASAAQFLVERQSPDGTWRSNHYRSFDDGTPLTPHVLSALMFMPRVGEEIAGACERGRKVLLNSVDDHGRFREPFASIPYPSYTASEIVWCVALDAPPPPLVADDVERRRVQSTWVAYVRRRQFNADLGWQASDPQYGGWGYHPSVARKPRPDDLFQPAAAPNLSATIFAIGALRAARVAIDDPAWRDARIFVERCQNYNDGGAPGKFDDGGFFFSPVDAAGNKAGAAGRDADGRLRFNSYGSMTADGMRALLQCGLTPDHPRVIAARRWLEQNFSVTTNPGVFPLDREVLRDATYYYYAWSLAHAMSRVKVREVDAGPAARVEWFSALADELLQRQNADGSWTNPFTDSREDDPLVATPFAAAALAICRERMNE